MQKFSLPYCFESNCTEEQRERKKSQIRADQVAAFRQIGEAKCNKKRKNQNCVEEEEKKKKEEIKRKRLQKAAEMKKVWAEKYIVNNSEASVMENQKNLEKINQ